MNKSYNLNQDDMDVLFISMARVIQITGISRSSIDRLEKRDAFPQRVPLTPRRVGWRKHEVIAWALANGKDRQKIGKTRDQTESSIPG